MMDDALLKRALSEAHLPALLVTLVQLTGDASLLRPEWEPKYAPYGDGRTGGLQLTEQEKLKDVAEALLRAHSRHGSWASPPPSDETWRSMMRFIAGTKISERYLPLLQEELGINRHLDEATQASSRNAQRKASRKLKVLVIGAGMSGLLAAIKLKQAGIEFEIVERNANVGGTWFENTYPGCRVDSQNHIYSYSFAPDHDMPSQYSTQDVLLRYFEGLSDRFGLRPHIRLNTTLDEAIFDEATGTWNVKLSGARAEQLNVNILISAVGQLNSPIIPDFPGGSNFAGAQFHSARWDHNVDLHGKRIAVIGTGASAFQFIPIVSEQAAQLSIFQRTAPWFMPTPDYHAEVGEGQKWLFKSLPFYANWYRFWLFWSITDGLMGAMKIDPDWRADDGSINAINQRIQNELVENMNGQLGERHDLRHKIRPNFPFGGKRTLRDNGQWVRTLKRTNVRVVSEGIDHIKPCGIVTKDGMEHPADVIIYGTGFHASRFLEPMRIIGRNGTNLTAHWSGEARAYLGMTIPNFPNLFCIYGPNTNLVAQGSIVFFSECSVRYILCCIAIMIEQDATSMEVKQSVHDVYNSQIDAANLQMAWGMPGISNWYKSASGRVSQNWPFPLFDYWDATRMPRSEDFVFGRQ